MFVFKRPVECPDKRAKQISIIYISDIKSNLSRRNNMQQNTCSKKIPVMNKNTCYE